jgi:hypothetical protein
MNGTFNKLTVNLFGYLINLFWHVLLNENHKNCDAINVKLRALNAGQIFCHSVGQTLFRFMAYVYNKAAEIPKHKTDGAPGNKKIIFIGVYT